MGVQEWRDTPAWKQRLLIAREIAAQNSGGRVRNHESLTSKVVHRTGADLGAKSGKSDFLDSAPGGRDGAV